VTPSYILSNLVLPPTSLVLLTLVGLLLLKRNRGLAIALIAISQLTLLLLATPAIANALARTLEPAPLTADRLKTAQAIVVLGGGRNRGAPEWGGETVNSFTLQRLRYAARLARESGLPLYVTGGKPDGGEFAEGTLMGEIMSREFAVPVRWIDTAADTTRENALMAARDLKPQRVERVVLVTTALHMPRSQRAFEQSGFAVVPAATDYEGQRPFAPYQLVPGPSALRQSHLALREWISDLYYLVRGN
jgi:uncharacterized SAM-binding protein YcdF (DUF218 family)